MNDGDQNMTINDVVVYSKNNCPKCNDLKKALDESCINYTEVKVDYDNSARDEVIEAGFRSMPVVKKNGEWVRDLMEIFE